MTTTTEKIAFAVCNDTLGAAIAIFETMEAAIAYSDGFSQCIVCEWTVPADLFRADDAEDDAPADAVEAMNASLLRTYDRECGR